RLEDGRRQLEKARADRARRDADDAIAQVDELQRQQREVQRNVRELPVQGPERRDRIERLRERKDQMNETVQNLERQLDGAASSARADERLPLCSRTASATAASPAAVVAPTNALALSSAGIRAARLGRGTVGSRSARR
ncbi:MAG: hypothetical protein WD981_03255, partial [Gaiellaceae bacterium]